MSNATLLIYKDSSCHGSPDEDPSLHPELLETSCPQPFPPRNDLGSLLSVSSSDGLYSGGLVFCLSTEVAVGAGHNDKEQERGNKQEDHEEGPQLQGIGLWESLQFVPHLLKAILHQVVKSHSRVHFVHRTCAATPLK